jgi:hypothetical protein
MIYLKTILTSETELKYIILNIKLLKNIISKVILIEPGFTHMGASRDLIFPSLALALDTDLLNRIIYVPILSDDEIHWDITDENLAHINENITRGCFTKIIKLNPFDIIISTDADEILDPTVISKCILLMKIFPLLPALSLTLKQHFFYTNWIVEGYKFTGPNICRAFVGLIFKGYYRWRYDGIKVPGYSGNHFSWCLSRQEIISKLKNIAHAPQYGDNAVEIYEKCLENKVFYFRKEPLPLTLTCDVEYLKKNEDFPKYNG